MATRNPEKEEKRKMQIVQAAYDVIASKGYNNFTIDDIANQAGLSKGGVLHYFKTKDEILIHLLEQIYMLIEKNIKKRSEKYKTPEKKLKAIIIAYIIIAKKHPAFYIVMVDFWAQITINERVKNINTRIYDKMCREIKKIIDLGVEQGVFNEIDTLSASFAIIAMVTNIAVQWTFNNSIYNIDHVSRKCMNIVMSYLKN
jgi:AcrR family transcriptional regulator